MTKNKQYWQKLAGGLVIEDRAFIDGEYVSAINGESEKVVNPANGVLLAEVTSCGPADADLAIKAARRAFNSGIWADMAPAERKRVILAWADLMAKHADELAILETLDVGKPISNTTAVDIPSAIATIRWNGEAIDKVYGEIAPTPAKTLGLVTRLPLGVVTAIVPWNFPLSTTAWKIAPALASGNSVILKPAANTPLTAIRIAGLAAAAGIPDGVFQVLPGPGSSLGQYLARHDGIDGITFTGSTPVGKLLMEYSAQSNLKRTFLELGGKGPNIVLADADIEKAAEMAATAVFYNSGQTCTAGTRLIVDNQILDEFLERVIYHSQSWSPGDPLDPDTTMGPLIDHRQYQTVNQYITQGIAEGAQLALGYEQVLEESGGHYHGPTIFSNVTNNMSIAREEIFGPVLSVIGFNDIEEAVTIANDSIFGLAGAVWSRNINSALSVAEKIRVGTMGVNNYFGGDITVPFGGFKQSGNGRDKSLHAFADYTELKTTWIEY